MTRTPTSAPIPSHPVMGTCAQSWADSSQERRGSTWGGVTELLREKRAQRAAPSRCLVADSQFASLGNARPAQAPVGGACAGELTERRRPARGDLFHPCPCVMTSWAREAALQQLRLRGLVSARRSCGARCKSSLRIKIKRP